MVRLITIVVVVVASLSIIVGAVFVYRRRKYAELREDWEKEYGPTRFSYKTLYKATKGFKDEQLIGKGGFGKVYRGMLHTKNQEIAVKRVSHNAEHAMKQFVSEIVSMGRLRHRNLVQLLGYCRRQRELFLVYDYMPNRSLDDILFDKKKPVLRWSQRFQIIKGVASALRYLHEEWEKLVLHRDIKSGNVLLDSDFNGKLADFGLARLYDHDSNPQTTILVGTLGFLAPELPRTGQATPGTDVYAFGVFLLEVGCGRKAIELERPPGEKYLVDWVAYFWKRGDILETSDPRLEGNFVMEEMELTLKLGLLCAHSTPEVRPTMRQVVQYLDGIVSLPDMPSVSIEAAVIIESMRISDIEASSPMLSYHPFSMLQNESVLYVGR